MSQIHCVRKPSTINMKTDDPVIQEACLQSLRDNTGQMVDLMGKKYMCMAYLGDRNEFVLREIFIARPVNPETPQWHGGCPPPVGAKCEFIKHNSPPAPNGQWEAGKILYLSECTIVIGVEGGERVHHPRNCSYRPIRTPEQIAAEERENGITEMRRQWSLGGERDKFAALWDAGYRKFEIVEGD